MYIAKNDNDEDMGRAALALLGVDQGALADIAKTGKTWGVRLAAVGRLTDQAALAEIAKTDGDWDVRLAAAAKLTDQALAQAAYGDVAKDDDWAKERCRHEAVSRLTDQAALADVARRDIWWY